MAMVDWHASLDKDFPEELPPETGTGIGISPPEPEPKRQKFDEPGLVPKDEFLAQHPVEFSYQSFFLFFLSFLTSELCLKVRSYTFLQGWCTIRVSVFVDRPLVIAKTVQSLSERVGSFKEKIAEQMRIPPEKQMLFGKSGLLEENNMSLAHYNVGAGEILTLL